MRAFLCAVPLVVPRVSVFTPSLSVADEMKCMPATSFVRCHSYQVSMTGYRSVFVLHLGNAHFKLTTCPGYRMTRCRRLHP
jgi:hypothetical protein